MPQRGRPAILNDDRRRAVCAILSKGGTLVDAARCLRCSVRVLQLEIRRNPKFREQVRSAKAEALLTPFQIIRQAARTNWRAARWMIERADQRRRELRANEQVGDYFEPPTADDSPPRSGYS